MQRVSNQTRLTAQPGEPRDLTVRRNATARNPRHDIVYALVRASLRRRSGGSVRRHNSRKVRGRQVNGQVQLWFLDTPRAIFPHRKIGRLADGYEASFIVLGGNPFDSFDALRDIRLRVKQGCVLRSL